MSPDPAFAPAEFAIPYGRILVVLLMTTLGSGALALWLRRLRPESDASGKLMRILDTLSLGPRRAVFAIDVNGRTILLSATQDRVELLTEILPNVAEAPAPEAAPSQPAPPPAGQAVDPTPTAPTPAPATPAPATPTPTPRVLPPLDAEPAFAQVLAAARSFNSRKAIA